MSEVSCKIAINAPADVIWQMISDFGMADQYLAGVVDCTVEGEGIGALSANCLALKQFMEVY